MPGTLSPNALMHAITAAGEAPDLDFQDAITTAYSWHGGGGSALYAFASNGGVIADEDQRNQLVSEVDETLAWVQTNAGDIDSGKFAEYAEDAEEASERGISTTDLIISRLNNLKSIAQQTVIVKEARQASAPLDAEELELYLENTSSLYPQKQSILKNLKRKMDKGTYDPNLAWRLWLYWVVAGAQAYAKEIGGGLWYQLFPVPVRQTLAKQLATTEEAKLRNGEYDVTPRQPSAAPNLPEPVMASTEKEAKVVISEDVFKRAQEECSQLLSQVAGQGNEVEGKLTKIQHELNKIEVASGGDLAFMLDDEENPDTANWARKLIQALSNLRGGMGGGASQLPSTQPQTPAAVSASAKEAGFTEDTLKAIIQFARTNHDELRQLLGTHGPQAVAAEIGKIPGAGNLAPRVAPAFVQWLSGNVNDSGFVGTLEKFFSKRGSLQGEDAEIMVSGALLMAGLRPTTITASGKDIALAGLKVNPHVLRCTAKVAADYGVNIKLQRQAAAYSQPGEQPGVFPEPPRQEPEGIQHAAPEGEPVVTPTEAAKEAGAKQAIGPWGGEGHFVRQSLTAPTKPGPVPPQPSSAGNHSGPANPENPTGEPAPGAPPAPQQVPPQPQPTVPAPEPPKPATGYGQREDGTGYGQKKASEGDLHAAVESAYEWHGGQSSYLYSFASLGGVLYKESWRGGLENEVESAIEAVKRQPESYDPDELDKLANLLQVAQTIPAKINDEEQDETGIQASKQAGRRLVVQTERDIPVGSYWVFRDPSGAVSSHKIEQVQPSPKGGFAVSLAQAGWQHVVPGDTIEVAELSVGASKQAADGSLKGTLAEIESMLNSLQELADEAVAKARIQGDPDLSANVERINVKVYEALMATRTGKADAKDITEKDTEGTQTVALVPVTAGSGPWSRRQRGYTDTGRAETQGVCKTPECGEKAEANGYCTYCGDPRSIPGKCDFCGAPVPPELKEENVCPGCAGGLRGTSYGGDEAAHRMMSSLHVAAPVAPPPVFTAEEANQWLEAIKTQIPAPYVGGYVSTLGGAQNASILMTISVDPKESWPNHILENSTYAKLHLTNDGVLNVISGYVRRPGGAPGRIQFRKSRVKDLPGAIAKLTALTTYLSSEREAAPAAPVLASKQAAEQLTKGPDASQGDTVDNAIEFINANSGSMTDFTVQELRDALAAAGYTQQVADEAVTDLLGNEALMALATRVKDLLG